MSDVKIIPDPYGHGRDIVRIEDCKVITQFNNFSGNYGYNGVVDPNNRGFVIILPNDEIADYLAEHDWRVKVDRDGLKILPVKVSYKFYDPTQEKPVPTIIKIDPKNKTRMFMDEPTVGQLDDFHASGFEYCDVVFKGSPASDGKTSAYLQWMQVVPNYSEEREDIDNLESKFTEGWEEVTPEE